MTRKKIALNVPAFPKSKFSMKSHRPLILLVTLLVAIAAHADMASLFTNTPARPAAIPRRASIIIIQFHDLARGDLSCFGQTNYQMPNLDKLAAEGVRFTNYVGGADSRETTAMLLAGKYAASPGETNLTALLKQGGYRTAFIGEWMFDREPWLRGADEFAGFFNDEEARDYFADHIWRYPRVTYDESNRVQSVSLFHEALYPNLGGKKGQYVPDVMFKAAASFIRIATPDRSNHWRPFFMVLNLAAPRSAVAGREQFTVPSDAPFTSEPWPQAAKDRAALITRLDAGLGQIFEQLGKSKMTNNYAIFVSSSSAPEKFANTNLNFLLPKADFRGTNNPSPKLPLIVRFPDQAHAGKVSGAPVSVVDIAPTALEIGYVKQPEIFTGLSIEKILRERTGTNSPTAPEIIGPPNGRGF